MHLHCLHQENMYFVFKDCLNKYFVYFSCHKKVTYSDVYKTYSGQCQVSDIFQDLDNRGNYLPLN